MTEQALRQIGDLPDDDYIAAFCIGDNRCSNVAQFKIDSDFDSTAYPTLSIIALELAPGQELPVFGIRAIGPTLQDINLQNDSIAFPKLIVDNIERQMSQMVWIGPVGPLESGKVYSRILTFNDYLPAIEPNKKHSIKAIVGKYESEEIIIPADDRLSSQWDEIAGNLLPVSLEKVALKGQVRGSDGKAGVNYEVHLFGQNNKRYSQFSDEKGEYSFVNIPSGQYQIVCNPKAMGQPGITIENVNINSNETLVMHLCLERAYNFKGKVFYEDGKPAAGIDVALTSQKTELKAEFNDFTTTDANGNYMLGGPFNDVTYIGINGTSIGSAMPRLKFGMNELNFELRKNESGNYRAYIIAQQGNNNSYIQPASFNSISEESSQIRLPILSHESNGANKEAEELMGQFQQALKDSDWNKALSLCSDNVKSYAAEFESQEIFFKTVVPVEEIKALTEVLTFGGRGQDNAREAYFCFVQISEPNTEPVINWQWSLLKNNSGWEIDFQNTTLVLWTLQERLRLITERNQSLEREKILREGLRLKLVPLSESFTIGKPMEFRMELKNISDSPIQYDTAEFYLLNDPLTIIDSNGNNVEYISGSAQTLSGPKTIDPNQIIVLEEKYDVTSQYYITKPGTYTFQFTGYDSTVVKSNVVEMNIAEGELSSFDKIYSVLKSAIPDDWGITQRRIRDNDDLNLKDDNGISISLIGDPGKKAVEGFVGVFLFINPSQDFLEAIDNEAKYLGKSQWGNVYINSQDAQTLWPDYREEIMKALGIETTEMLLRNWPHPDPTEPPVEMKYADVEPDQLIPVILDRKNPEGPDELRLASAWFLWKTKNSEQGRELRMKLADEIVEEIHKVQEDPNKSLHDCYVWASLLGPLETREQTLLLLQESPRFSCHYGPELVESLSQCGTILDVQILIDTIDKESEGAGAVVNKALEKITGVKMPLKDRHYTDKIAWQKWWEKQLISEMLINQDESFYENKKVSNPIMRKLDPQVYQMILDFLNI